MSAEQEEPAAGKQGGATRSNVVPRGNELGRTK